MLFRSGEALRSISANAEVPGDLYGCPSCSGVLGSDNSSMTDGFVRPWDTCGVALSSSPSSHAPIFDSAFEGVNELRRGELPIIERDCSESA